MQAVVAGDVVANIKGVATGNGWQSPVDYTNTWATYLHASVRATRRKEKYR